MPTLEMDSQTLTVPEGTCLLAAARQLGIEVPALCAHAGLEPATSCMVCVVEDRRTGKLFPACSTLAAEGMQVSTASAAVVEARRTALELLLGDHLGDCEGPCRRACPAGMEIPRLLRHIGAGRLHAAVHMVQRDLVLPAVLGRICPAPCEKVCRRGTQDDPVAIGPLHRHVVEADRFSADPYRPDPAPPSGARVAVVGGGPAGLSAAAALCRAGHACTLFEKRERLGGQLRNPALHAKLPAEALEEEIRQILCLGPTVATGVELGRSVSLEELKRQFDAVILAGGETEAATVASWGLESGAHGLVADRKTGRSGDPMVWACGNILAPGRMAVRAVAHGRVAAASVDGMLRGESAVGLPRRYDHRLSGRLDPEELAACMAGAESGPRMEPASRAVSAAEARVEAARCLHCDCRKPDACQLRRMAAAHGIGQHGWKAAERRRWQIVRHGRTLYEPGKCIACGICVRMAEKAQAPFGFTFVGRGFDVRIGVPFNEPLEKEMAALAAECVTACPTGALAAAQEGDAGEGGERRA